MNTGAIIISAAAGYFSGAISFARLVVRLFTPGSRVKPIRCAVPGTDTVFESDAVSATAVRLQSGNRYGCITGLLDLCKAAVPVLVIRHLFPDTPCYLVTAATVLIGHNWPVYYRFKGGRGESVIYGALLIIDPLGVLATTGAAITAGFVFGSFILLRWGCLILMIPWLWFRTSGVFTLVYMLFANVVFWLSMMPEIRQYAALKKKAGEVKRADLTEVFGMGRKPGEFLDRYSLRAQVWRRLYTKTDQER